MRKFTFYILLLVFIFSEIRCTKEKNGSNDDAAKSNFVVMTNADDPLLVTYAKEGNTIDFFGQRDSEGVPTKVDKVIVGNSTDTTIYDLDETGRPIKVATQNGTQYEFNWITAQKAVLTILSGDGLTQINTSVDFSDGSLKSNEISNVSKRIKKPLRLTFSTPEAKSFKSTASEGNCTVNVNSCGGPTYADVMVFVKSENGQTLGVFPTKSITKGIYTTTIPTNLAPTMNPSEICNSIVATLEPACVLNDIPGIPLYLCSSISAALAASGVGAPAAALILASCSSVAAGIELYCTTIGYSPVPGTPSIADQICNSQTLNRTMAEDIVIIARATSLPYNTYSLGKLVKGSGPFPDLSIELSSETAIRTLKLIPSSPVAGQDYVAEGNIFCLIAGTTVKLTIVGSDGYTDNTEYAVTTIQPEGLFTLTVPGGDLGVNDVVTLEITLPNGTKLTRTASLVFG